MMATLLTLALATGPALTLDEALVRAKSNPRAAAARATVDQARHRIDEARAGFYPSANALFGYSRATGNYAPSPGLTLRGATPEASNQSFGYYSTALNVNQMVWDFGRTNANVAAAEALARSSETDVVAADEDLALAVRAAFFTTLATEALAHAAADNTAAQHKHVDQARVQVDVGKRPVYDVTRARIDLGNAEVAELQANNAVLQSRAELSHAIGSDVGQAPLAPPAPVPDTADPGVEAAVTRALGARPELAQVDARLAAQAAVLDAAGRAYWPTIGANGQVNLRGADFPLVYNWQLGAAVTVPILAGGGDAARIEEQAAALEALRRSREAVALDVRLDVENQVLAVAEAKARVKLAVQVIEQAREAVRLSEGRYAAGAGSIVELVDAQTALTASEAQAIRAGFDLAVARARLQRAIGEP